MAQLREDHKLRARDAVRIRRGRDDRADL
jgi:hypothetical protein